MNRIAYSLVALAILQSPIASAQPTNFNYGSFSMGYGVTSVNGYDKDAYGFQVSATVPVVDNIFLIGGYNGAASVTVHGDDVRSSNYRFGLGLAYPIAYKTDVSTTMSYLHYDTKVCDDSSCSKYSDNGYDLGVGLKHWILDGVDGSLSYNVSGYSKTIVENNLFQAGIGIWPSHNQRFGVSYYATNDSDGFNFSYGLSF